MLTDENCKKILEQNGNHYTIEETRIIKQFLSELLEIHMDQLLKLKTNDEKSSLNGKSFQ
jgi:hypothetical protein